MTEKTRGKTVIMCGILFAIFVALMILSYFFPYIMAIAILFMIPITVYLSISIKYYLLGIGCIALYGVLLIVNHSPILYLLFPVFVCVSIGMAAGLKCNKIRLTFAVSAIGATVGFAVMLIVASVCMQSNPMTAARKYIVSTDSDFIYRLAVKDEVNERLYNVEGQFTSKEIRMLREKLNKEVLSESRSQIMENYAIRIEGNLYGNMLEKIFFFIPFLAGLNVFLMIVLIRFAQSKGINLNRSYEFSSMREWSLPKGYMLGTMIPICLLFLIGLSNDTASIACTAVYTLLVVVPFSICGIATLSYLFTRNGKHYIIASIITAIILVFLYPIFLIIGFVDHMIKLRKIIEIFDKTEAL